MCVYTVIQSVKESSPFLLMFKCVSVYILLVVFLVTRDQDQQGEDTEKPADRGYSTTWGYVGNMCVAMPSGYLLDYSDVMSRDKDVNLLQQLFTTI